MAQIPPMHLTLSEGLANLVKQFDFDQILELASAVLQNSSS
jgi:hypothetical protein